MQTKRAQPEPTKVVLWIAASQDELQNAKQIVLRQLSKRTKLPGFRPGKVPLNLVEKNTDPNELQNDVVDTLLNMLYPAVLESERLRPVAQPNVVLKKFVPFSELEFTAEVEVVGEVHLPAYKSYRLKQKKAEVSDEEVEAVIHSLQQRGAEKNEVTRAAKQGDEVLIDFVGTDAEKNEPVRGADGKGYPLILGSNTFIPGFEKNLVGMKPESEKSFTLKFPGDYSVSALRNKSVTFKVTVNKVHELTLPKLDDAFAAKAGPFKTMAEMRKDIRNRLEQEKRTEKERELRDEIIEKLAKDTEVALPEILVKEEIERTEQEVKRNLVYRGETWAEFLESQGLSEEKYRETVRDPALLRLKASIALTEIAKLESITVSPEEFNQRMQLLKAQYNDPAMRAELEKQENARDIMSSMLTEKTVAKLKEYAVSNDRKTPATSSSKKK